MGVNTHIPGAHSCGPSTWPDDRADLFNADANVWPPSTELYMLWSNTQAPQARAELVSVKRLTAHPRWPMCLVSSAARTMSCGDISPLSTTSVHVAIINGWKVLPLALPSYVNTSKTQILLYYFISLWKTLCLSSNTLLLLLQPRQSSSPQLVNWIKVRPLTHECLTTSF